jgi:hypothetical protein
VYARHAPPHPQGYDGWFSDGTDPGRPRHKILIKIKRKQDFEHRGYSGSLSFLRDLCDIL